MKSFIIILIIVLVLLGIGWYFSKSAGPADNVVTRNGLHWHSVLSIDILGESQVIPAGLGLERLPHNPMHTHDRDSVIHMEYAGLVRNTDLQVGKFFKVWGKTFDQNCIFDNCSGPDGQLKMLVNGKENLEFENYIMRDNDKIEIIFEKAAVSPVKEITVRGNEFSFDPNSITVLAGEKVKLTFKNNGSAPHNLVIEELGIGTKTIGSGSTDVIEFTAPAAGDYAISCSVPGHKEAGMKSSLIVE